MPSGVYVHKPFTKEHKEKLRQKKLGKNNPNFQIGRYCEISKKQYCKNCGKNISCTATYCQSCFQIGERNPFYGKHHTKETIEKLSGENNHNWKDGITHQTYCKDCGKPIYYSSTYCNHCSQRGKRSSRWKGDIIPLYQRIRTCFEYRQWRSDVFTRDNFTCQECGDAIGGNLNAHHKIEFADIIERHEITNLEEALKCEELWNTNNGITLCEDCHKLIHNNPSVQSVSPTAECMT
jgi:5-methylcytosine-specific restriction endonuclease McrA